MFLSLFHDLNHEVLHSPYLYEQVDPALDASEESQLAAAIQASLKDVDNKKTQELIFESDSDDDEELETFTDSEEVGAIQLPILTAVS